MTFSNCGWIFRMNVSHLVGLYLHVDRSDYNPSKSGRLHQLVKRVALWGSHKYCEDSSFLDHEYILS